MIGDIEVAKDGTWKSVAGPSRVLHALSMQRESAEVVGNILFRKYHISELSLHWKYPISLLFSKNGHFNGLKKSWTIIETKDLVNFEMVSNPSDAYLYLMFATAFFTNDALRITG